MYSGEVIWLVSEVGCYIMKKSKAPVSNVFFRVHKICARKFDYLLFKKCQTRHCTTLYMFT